MPHPLDKPIWAALASRQAHFAEGGPDALRFPPDVSPFAASRDATRTAVDALAALIPAGGDISLLEVDPPVAPDGVEATQRAGVQMTLRGLPGGGRDAPIEPLGEADAADMLALATLTRPGPFRTRTHSMGRFLGIRDGGRLVAMGGERLSLEGFTEVTALCTHPDWRGRGYGEALLRAVSAGIQARGDTPFLHSYADNEVALELYRRNGFELRASVIHTTWKRAVRAG